MFLKNRQKPNSRIETLIGAETTIIGHVHFNGGLRVDGSIRGDVKETGGKPCTLVLSEHGRIEGKIDVSHAVINGAVIGPVYARDYVELQSKSRVSGDVYYKTLEIHTGAVVEGKLVYISESVEANQEVMAAQD